MANTSIVYARIGTELKEDAEEILFQLGIVGRHILLQKKCSLI